ncbi:MAG: hypothetical protein RLZZ274_336 [Cyanobacteriota bacterium]
MGGSPFLAAQFGLAEDLHWDGRRSEGAKATGLIRFRGSTALIQR